MGPGRIYTTAIVAGVLLLCLVVLGARWSTLSRRVPLAELQSAAAGGDASSGPVAAAASPSPSPDSPVDINTATADHLARLPGIGEVLAARIIEHREQHGPFSSVESLLQVHGIGAKKLDALRDMAVCNPATKE